MALHLGPPGFGIGDYLVPSEDGTEIYQFSHEGRHQNTYDALTGALRYKFGYDAAGRLESIKDANKDITTIERDATGNHVAIRSPFGQRTLLTLDDNSYLANVTNPAGETYRMTYTDDGLLTQFTDPNGHASTLSYDEVGRLKRDQDAQDGYKELTSTTSGNTRTVTLSTALGRTTTYQTDDLTTGDQQRTNTEPDGTKTITVISANGSWKTTFPDGTITNLLEGPDPRFGMQSPIPASVTTTTGGLTATLSMARTAMLTDPKDPLSLTSLTDKITLNGRTFTSIYDNEKKTVTRTSAKGRKSAAVLDPQGRIIQSQVARLLTTNLSYDPHGRLASITQGTDADARTATLSYKPEGYLDTITDPLGHTLGFTYDAAGRVTRQTLPDGREIGYAYDASGNLTSLTPPGRPAHVFKYTKVDLANEYIPPDVGAGSNSTLYEYNLDKELTKITRPDGQALVFDYDTAKGRLATLTLPTGQIGYTYDDTTGKLKEVLAKNSAGTVEGKLDYTYKGALLTQTSWAGAVAGSVTRDYDNDFRVKSLSVNGTNAITYQYDDDSLLTQAGNLILARSAENGLLTGTTLGNVTDSYDYDGFAEVEAYEAKYGTNSLLRFEYKDGYDKLGRITKKKEIRGGTTRTFEYGYDTVGRLIEIKRDGVVVSSYGYDANGNRTHLNGVEVAHYDNQDRLLDYQGATYQYTANGELKRKTVAGHTTQYDYDVLGNLGKVTFPDGSVIDYVIDGQNRQIGRKVNGALAQGFLYQGQLQPIAELDNTGKIVSRFVYSTGVNVPDYMVKAGVTYRIIKDHLGSPRLVVDVATNTVAQEMDYDAFGNITLDTNPGFQPFGFAGGLYDRDTKFVRFGARDYEAETGRWAAKDPIMFFGGDSNLYQYVMSDPINRDDSTGLIISKQKIRAIVIALELLFNKGKSAIAKELERQDKISETIRKGAKSIAKKKRTPGGGPDPGEDLFCPVIPHAGDPSAEDSFDDIFRALFDLLPSPPIIVTPEIYRILHPEPESIPMA